MIGLPVRLHSEPRQVGFFATPHQGTFGALQAVVIEDALYSLHK